MTVNGTVVPTAEEALVVTEVAPARGVLARVGLVVRALTLLFILTDGIDTAYPRVKTTFSCTPTTGVLALTKVLTTITLVGGLPPSTRPRPIRDLTPLNLFVGSPTLIPTARV